MAIAIVLATMQLMAQQTTTMIMKLTNGAVVRTDVSEVEKITFSDTLYNLNSAGLRILEADELCWPEDRLLPHFLTPAVSVRSLDMNAAALSNEERVMFCTLQGIVNRTRPRILLYNHNEEPQSTWPTAHSLRTVAISSTTPYSLVKLYKDEINGLILLASYPVDDLGNMPVLSIYGSNDKTLNKETYDESKSLMDNNLTEYVINGGNHAQFGSYGNQSGDGIATISPENQRDQTEKAILDFIF